MKIEGSGSASGSSISQRHGSADPDPDPHQNVMDPEHWVKGRVSDPYLFDTDPDPAFYAEYGIDPDPGF